jgi:hypothetical protein
MATMNDKEMADNAEFEQSFNDAPASGGGGDDFGLMPGEETMDAASDGSVEGAESSDGGGAPAAVVIVEEEAGGGQESAGAEVEEAANAAAADEAKAVTDAANAQAAADAGSESTATQEAAGEADGAKAAPGEQQNGGSATEVAGAQEAAAGGLDDLSDVPAEDMQKAKSWIGRLKKMEADLKARAGEGASAETAPVAEAVEQAAVDKLADGDEAGAEKLDQIAADVASGDMSLEQAKSAIAEDFGDNFVKMIEAIAKGAAGAATDEKIGSVKQDVEGVIGHLTDSAARQHFETIYEAHPDFMEIANSPAFQEFVSARGAQDVVDNGSAKDINKLLDAFAASKDIDHGDTPNGAPVVDAVPAAETQPAQDAVAAAAPTQDAVNEDDMDAAEGVRSAGLRLPEDPQPSESDDYLDAWNKA